MEVKEAAIYIARKAGELLRENLGRVESIEYKGAVDLVTDVDRKSETLIVDFIKERFADHDILTEEGQDKTEGSPCRWIIDPLDGTTNYAHGYPVFCVSIGFEEEGELRLGVVYDPMLEELFVAENGGGAYLNGRRIRVSATPTLDKSLLSTGFPYDLRTSRENNLNHFSNFAMRAQAIRRAGSAALDMCYVGCGRFDGFWELKLKPWDVAAGSLVVKEAGGRLTDFNDSPFSIYGYEVIASNGLIHQEMVEVVNLKTVVTPQG